tara:strand:- start:569 stop:1153 length:585 start_codon:yes stop_codon:yes gene_type:complete
MDKQNKERNRLKALLLQRSLRLGDFALAGGGNSSYYVDARRTTMTAEGQGLTGKICYDLIQKVGWNASHVGGLTLGADPVTYAIAQYSCGHKVSLDGFTIRKEAKAHGTQQKIEGGLPKDAQVVIIEDAITSGASVLAAINAVSDHGAIILGALCLVDREEGARDRLDKLGIQLVSVFTGKELLRAAKTITSSD